MFGFVGKRFWLFMIAGVAALVSIISLAIFGLHPGVELSSGSIVTLAFEQEVDQNALEQELANLDYGDALVQLTGAGDFIIRTGELTGEEKTRLENALIEKFGQLTETEFNSVSAMVAEETSRDAALAVALASVGILLYITWAFRRMPKPFRYGTCAVVALLHDALIALGVFAILGGITGGWEINLMFITGIMAVIGYSVNNTVVVFDRIRENLMLGVSPQFGVVVNNSIIESLGRALNTSLTTLFVVIAMLLFVGASIRNFTVVLLVGIIAGTFSSLFVAPMLLVVWENGKWGRAKSA